MQESGHTVLNITLYFHSLTSLGMGGKGLSVEVIENSPPSPKPNFCVSKITQIALSLQLIVIADSAGKSRTTFSMCQVPVPMSPLLESPQRGSSLFVYKALSSISFLYDFN